MDYKVHIGYGFHVNCYHSYRGDTNDELGFGGDIRIIRKIIELLNNLNEKGVPVKGTWDFENAYSLEEILPQYAPDIITGVKDRVKKYGDENIIMGYNNGALSAMTKEEFTASIEWAVTNSKGSGLEDVFGECEKIVRPQEFMFTPSQVSLYNELGIKAVCLYYSCVPFDAFRTIIPQLSDEKAFNPVTYTYKGESMLVLPTYSNCDVIDAGSLRCLAMDLHSKQLSGEINNDVFIFINMDADANFWEPFNLPFPLNRIANTDGIRGLVNEVADLEFVEFNTPGGYLKNHKPLADIVFTQDTADGSFTGYSSWAEKPFNRQIWTRLERARAYAKAGKSDSGSPSFEDRVMLLSTTHFGLASPMLNVQRENRALELSERMVQKELAAQKGNRQLTLVNPGLSTLVTAQISFDAGFAADAARLSAAAAGLNSFGMVPMDYHADGSVETAFLICRFETAEEKYVISIEQGGPGENTKAAPRRIASENLKVNICEHGEVLSVYYKDKKIGGKDFIRSFLDYNDQKYYFGEKQLQPLKCAGSAAGTRIAGEIHLPQELEAGVFSVDLFTVKEIDCVFLQMRVKYPYTKEEYSVSTQSSALGRNIDAKWQQAVPLQIQPRFKHGISVVKRNFMNDVSAYPVSSFGESVPENSSIDSFNNHLTNGMVGLSDGETGLILANAKQVLCSMAHCPMRLKRCDGSDTVSMNPFGTYYGKQRVHPSRSNGAVRESFVVIAPQARSIAPAYNGVEENSVMALFAYEGLLPDEAALSDIAGFADGAAVLAGENSSIHPCTKDNIRFKAIKYNKVSSGELKSVMSSGVATGRLRTARIAASAIGNIVLSQIKARKADTKFRGARK